jgi:hypothetical protein
MTGDPTNREGDALVYLSVIAIIFFGLIFYLVVKYLIPAINRQNALVLNNEFIIDNIRKNVISGTM